MSLHSRIYSIRYRVFTSIQGTLGLILVAWGAALKADPLALSRQWVFAGILLRSMQTNAYLVIPIGTVIVGCLQLYKRHVGHPSVWNAVHSWLDAFRANVFEDYPAEQDHRVTLFKHKDYHLSWYTLFRKPWLGFLIPIERSGEVTQNPSVIFSAPRSNPNRAEGIAGYIWKTKECHYVCNLPELNDASSDKTCKTYSRKSKTNKKYVLKRAKTGKPFARSFWGTPVEVNGKCWGVIVIDSRHPELAGKDEIKAIFQPMASVLGKLLEYV
jgi:hypothetical protein